MDNHDITPIPQSSPIPNALPDQSEPNHPHHPPSVMDSFRQPLIQYLLMFLAVLCVYVPTFWYTYVWDDWSFIVKNESIREWKNIPKFFTDSNTFSYDPERRDIDAYRPVRNIYYLITYKLHGFRPAGWHFHQVLIHCLASSLLLAVFHRIYRYYFRSRNQSPPTAMAWASWLCVFAWAVHPVNTEVTAWLKSADDILAVIFNAIVLLLLFPENGVLTWRRMISAGILFLTGLLSKESIAPTALIFPVLSVGLSPSIRAKFCDKRLWQATAILFLTLAIYLALRKLTTGKIEQVPYLTGSFSLMMATMTTAIVRYFQITFWPWWPTVQAGDYLLWPLARSWNQSDVILSLCILGVVLTFTVVIARRNRVFALGILWTIFAFTPAANIVPMMQVLAERFLYFPLIGLAFALSSLVIPGILRIRNFIWVPVTICIALVVQTEIRLPVWVDEQNFQKVTAEADADGWRSKFNYAITLRNDGETTKALTMALEAQKIAPSLHGGILITELLMQNDYMTTASSYVDKLTSAFPDEAHPRIFKGKIYEADGKTTQAFEEYGKATLSTGTLTIEEHRNAAYFLRAKLGMELGETTEALKAASKLIELDPDWKQSEVIKAILKNEINE